MLSGGQELMSAERPEVAMFLNRPAFGGTESYLTALLPHLRKYCRITLAINDWEDNAVLSGFREGADELLHLPVGDEYGREAVHQLAVWMRDRQPQVVHTFSRCYHHTARAAALMAGESAVIVDYRNTFSRKFNKGRYVKIEGQLMKLTDRLLFNAETSQRDYLDFWKLDAQAWGSRMGIIPNGLDLARFRQGRGRMRREEFGIVPGAWVIGTAARLHPAKRYDLFFEMAARLCPQYPNLVFVSIGTGEPEFVAEYQQQIDAMGLKGRVLLLGSQTGMETIYPMLDAFVLCSEYEGFSRAFIEAMACGVPVIAHGALPNSACFENATQMLKAQAWTGEEFAALAEKLLQDPALCERIGAAGCQAAARYDIAHSAEALWQIYQPLLVPDARRRAAHRRWRRQWGWHHLIRRKATIY